MSNILTFQLLKSSNIDKSILPETWLVSGDNFSLLSSVKSTFGFDSSASIKRPSGPNSSGLHLIVAESLRFFFSTIVLLFCIGLKYKIKAFH